MDPMKQNDIQKVEIEDPVTGGVITEIDSEGKPVAGRYPIDPGSPILDIDTSDGGAVHLTPVQERKAEILAVDNAVKWIKAHPNYTMEELKKEKARLLEEARIQVSKE